MSARPVHLSIANRDSGGAHTGGRRTTATKPLQTLARLRRGQVGRIADIRANGHPELATRILEIGLVRGTTVRYLRAAPLGDPIEVDVEGFLLSMRRNEAEAVIVETD